MAFQGIEAYKTDRLLAMRAAFSSRSDPAALALIADIDAEIARRLPPPPAENPSSRVEKVVKRAQKSSKTEAEVKDKLDVINRGTAAARPGLPNEQNLAAKQAEILRQLKAQSQPTTAAASLPERATMPTLTIKQAAKTLGIDPLILVDASNDGSLATVVGKGKKVGVTKAALDAWQQAKAAAATAATQPTLTPFPNSPQFQPGFDPLGKPAPQPTPAPAPQPGGGGGGKKPMPPWLAGLGGGGGQKLPFGVTPPPGGVGAAAAAAATPAAVAATTAAKGAPWYSKAAGLAKAHPLGALLALLGIGGAWYAGNQSSKAAKEKSDAEFARQLALSQSAQAQQANAERESMNQAIARYLESGIEGRKPGPELQYAQERARQQDEYLARLQEHLMQYARPQYQEQGW